jgi:hypothetical protein
MRNLDYCPECGIGLNNREEGLGFCSNCKANWEPDYSDEDEIDEDGFLDWMEDDRDHY